MGGVGEVERIYLSSNRFGHGMAAGAYNSQILGGVTVSETCLLLCHLIHKRDKLFFHEQKLQRLRVSVKSMSKILLLPFPAVFKLLMQTETFCRSTG